MSNRPKEKKNSENPTKEGNLIRGARWCHKVKAIGEMKEMPGAVEKVSF